MASSGGHNQDEEHVNSSSSREHDKEYQTSSDFLDVEHISDYDKDGSEASSDAAWDNGFVHLSSTKNISVRFLRRRIIHCRVQAIVLPHNRKFDHSGGLAKAVFSVAGGSVYDDLKRQTGGHVQEPGTVLITNGGALKEITHILHIVSPFWKNYENRTGKMECLYILQTALFRCFKLCVDKSLISVAFPAIWTEHGIPARLCYLVYASALMKMDEYCRLKGVTDLQIYFVDISENIITSIYKECNRAFSCGHDSTADQISNELDKDLRITSHIFRHRFHVKAYKGDISIFRQGSIICAVNKDLTPGGSDTEEIAHKAGASYTHELQAHRLERKYKEGQVAATAAGDLSSHVVLHCIIPRKKSWLIGREEYYREKLKECYRNAFQMVPEKRNTVVALSVLGIDSGYLNKDLCCSALMDALGTLFESLDETTSINELHIVCRVDKVFCLIETLLKKQSK